MAETAAAEPRRRAGAFKDCPRSPNQAKAGGRVIVKGKETSAPKKPASAKREQ